MQIFVRWFLRMSLVWLGVGMLLALIMAFDPTRVPMMRLAHAHALLAMVHLWAVNLGLVGIVTGWLTAGLMPGAWTWLHRGGAVAFALGAALFIYNIWKTLEAPKWNALQQR